MKKSILLPLVLLAGATCLSLMSAPKRVEAKVAAKYEADVHPVDIYYTDDEVSMYNYNELYHMIDGDLETMAWFNGQPDSITIDYGKPFILHDIEMSNGKTTGGDYYYASVEYSLDGSTWTPLANLYENIDSMHKDVVLDFYNNPVETRFLRLVDIGTVEWVAVTEFKVNQIEARVSFENLEIEDPIYGHSDINDMIDDDNSTFTWFRSLASEEEKALILSYNEPREVAYIELMMGRVESQSDYMEEVSFYYAIDDNKEWILAEDAGEFFSSLSNKMILKEPVLAKHIKAVSSVAKPNGLIVREFSTHSNNPIVLENYREFESLDRGASAYPVLLNNIRNINDENLETYVDLKPVDASKECAIIHDLEEVKKVNEIKLETTIPWGDNFANQGGRVLVSADGNAWNDITEDFTISGGQYLLTGIEMEARYVKLAFGVNVWIGLAEFNVSATDMFKGGLNASFGGGYSDAFDNSNFGLRFLIPVANGTATTDYKAVVKAGSKSLEYTLADKLVETNDGNLRLTVLLGNIVNNYSRLTTEFTVEAYYKDGLAGKINYSVESIVREYLYLNAINKVALSDEQVEFLVKLNNYAQELNGNKIVEPEQPIEKVMPEVVFSINSGATLTLGVDAAPTVTVPEGVEYITYYELDGVKISDTLPTTPGTYSFIIETVANDQYYSTRDWRWFRLVENKLTPEIVIMINGEEMVNGMHFASDSTIEPEVTVTEGLSYVTYYELNNVRISDTMPTTPGTYSFIVEVTGNDQYNDARIWRWFVVE